MKIAIGADVICQSKGGTQRAAINLANELITRGHEVVMLCRDYGNPPVYPLNPQAKIYFYADNFKYGEAGAIKAVREYLKAQDIDAFISMQSTWVHMLWGLACLGIGIPFICSERSDPRYSETVTWSKAGRDACLACADYIHELSEAHIETVPPVWRDKVRVIPNAAPVADLAALPRVKKEPAILFLARFRPSKRADLLIKAFATLADRFPDWQLRLKGVGEDANRLTALCRRYKLSGRVSIGRPVENIFAEFASAEIYCLPTQVEGFPNSCLEAMACGLPVVGVADCPPMAALAAEGGCLAASEATPEALAAQLAKLMESPKLRSEMGRKGLALCQSKYSQARVYDAWENLLTEAAMLKGKTIMDSFKEEPFASMAILSSACRKERLFRHFGDPMPFNAAWHKAKIANFIKNACSRLLKIPKAK